MRITAQATDGTRYQREIPDATIVAWQMDDGTIEIKRRQTSGGTVIEWIEVVEHVVHVQTAGKERYADCGGPADRRGVWPR